jgi:ribosome-binding factor A
MTRSRNQRLAEALRQSVADLLRREIRDPRIGFVTPTGARVSPDLSQGRLFVSFLGPEPARAASLRALNRAAGYLQREVFRRLRLRKAMSLVFVADESVAAGSRVEALLEELHRSARSTADGEPAPEEEE